MPADRFGSDRRERTTKQITFDTAEEIYNLRENKQSRWTLRWPGQLQMLHSCRWMDVARLRDATPTWRALWGRRTWPSAAKSAFLHLRSARASRRVTMKLQPSNERRDSRWLCAANSLVKTSILKGSFTQKVQLCQESQTTGRDCVFYKLYNWNEQILFNKTWISSALCAVIHTRCNVNYLKKLYIIFHFLHTHT